MHLLGLVFFSFTIMLLRLIYIVGCGYCSFPQLLIFFCVTISQFMYPFSVDGHEICFWYLAVMSFAAMNITVHISKYKSLPRGYLGKPFPVMGYTKDEFWKIIPDCFSEWLYWFTFSLGKYGWVPFDCHSL